MTTVVNIRDTKEFDVYIGRACRGHRKSPWANQFRIGRDGDRVEVIAKYLRFLLCHGPDARIKERIDRELRGKVLGCWCKPLPCHGDILAAIADSEET